MSDDEQMAIIGRMVTKSKTLRQKEAALLDQVDSASRVFDAISKSLANYKGNSYASKFDVEPDMIKFANMDEITMLINELIQTRQDLRELQERLNQVS
jgi:hypothetical protein